MYLSWGRVNRCKCIYWPIGATHIASRPGGDFSPSFPKSGQASDPAVRVQSATGAVLCMHGPAATEEAVFLTTEATCATPEGIPYRAICDLVLYTSKVVVGGAPQVLTQC